jgi:hypothetical protein
MLFFVSILILLIVGYDAQPTSSMFPIRRIDEVLFSLTKISPREKIEYYQYLISKYFSDILFVVQSRHTEVLLSASLRYSTLIGKTAQFALANNIEKDELRIELQGQQEKLRDILTNSKFSYGRQKYIEDAINYIDIYKAKL